MKIDFDNNVPIYLQIVNYLKIHIISGKYELGSRLPSVRDLALEVKVNPNTMQKALVELENLKLIYTERTNGKFITNDNKLIEKYKGEYAKELTNNYLKTMQELGLNLEETKKIMEVENVIRN